MCQLVSCACVPRTPHTTREDVKVLCSRETELYVVFQIDECQIEAHPEREEGLPPPLELLLV